LSESVGVERFGTKYRYRDDQGHLDGAPLPLDLAANAASLGAIVLRAANISELTHALAQARANSTTTVVHIEDDPSVATPDSTSWWDVPVAEVSTRTSTREARARYEIGREIQRAYLRPTRLDVDPAP
jgi:3D-(3,5/4)-trihydroxycyclohexane-1,2-dione acylhydrolase (decyclizing)